LNRLEDFDKILCGGDAIEGDLDEIIFNPIASTISKMVEDQSSEVDAIPAPFRLAQQWLGLVG
jgi:hypothetical protein